MDKLLDNAPCCFITARDDGKIENVNSTVLSVLGYDSKNEIIGNHIERLLTPGARIFYQTHVFPLLKLHGKADEIYLDIKTKENRPIPVLLNGERRNADEKHFVNTYVCIPIRHRSRFEDELLLAKKEAEAASRAKDEFLSVVSHELRSPLNAILGWTKILETSTDDKNLVQRAVKTIRNNAKIQVNLVDDILDVSRMVTGKMRLEVKEKTDVNILINRVIDSVNPAIAKKQIQIVKKDRNLPMIVADPERLQQVFWNLLNNSVKFTPSGGNIEIAAEAHKHQMQIWVRDTGQGISPDFLPFVFGRFEQNDASRSRRTGGLGLGLAISKQIVELHGGTIHAESEGEGKGSKFTVTLPL